MRPSWRCCSTGSTSSRSRPLVGGRRRPAKKWTCSTARDFNEVVAELPEDHHCPWREEAERLRVELAGVRAELEEVRGQFAALKTAMEALERRVLGPKS